MGGSIQGQNCVLEAFAYSCSSQWLENGNHYCNNILPMCIEIELSDLFRSTFNNVCIQTNRIIFPEHMSRPWMHWGKNSYTTTGFRECLLFARWLVIGEHNISIFQFGEKNSKGDDIKPVGNFPFSAP